MTVHIKFFAGPMHLSVAASDVGMALDAHLAGTPVEVACDYERPVPCVLAVTTWVPDVVALPT